MNYSDVPNPSVQLTPQNMENIFSVNQDASGFYYFNLIRTINFPVDLDPSSYTIYQVAPNDMWPSISWKVYKNVKLWWLICTANQIQNPVIPPTPGTQLKIINRDVVKTILNQIQPTP